MDSWIGILIITLTICTILGICVYLFVRKKQGDLKKGVPMRMSVTQDPLSTDSVSFEKMTAALDSFAVQPVEVQDRTLVGRIMSLAPEAVRSTATAVSAIESGTQVLYKAHIPADVVLASSHEMKGMFRGFYHRGKGIAGHANWERVSGKKQTLASAASSVMGIASMVVGQYYMSQIDANLTAVGEKITHISEFQDNEYRGKVESLVMQVRRIAAFRSEALENSILREEEIANLSRMEQECSELLGQAQISIEQYLQRQELTYDTYENELPRIHSWYMYQKLLLEVLQQIADLKYTLHIGEISRENCYFSLQEYAKRTEAIATRLTEWHGMQIERFEIDETLKTRRRNGVDGLLHKIPGMIRDEQNYRPLPQKVSEYITAHTTEVRLPRVPQGVDLFGRDVDLIIRDGKVYYLPATE